MTTILINPFAHGSAPAISAPGTITLGTPDAFGIPYTMPSLPSGAGSLIIQASTDNATWTDCYTGLSGGATGYFQLSPTAGSAIGHQNELTYLRAKNTNGGATGASTSATTVDLPATPDPVISLAEIDEDFTVRVTVGSFPARAYEFLAYGSDTIEESPPSHFFGTVPESNYSDFGDVAGGGTSYWGLKAQNLYGQSAMSSLTGINLIPTPGTMIAAGDPDGNGVPFQMPTLPGGAGSFRIQGSNDDSTWYDAMWPLASEESGYFRLAFDGGSPEGHGGETIYLRARNEVGGKAGPSMLAVCVNVPTDPSFPPSIVNKGRSNEDPDPPEYWFNVQLPEALPDGAINFHLYASGSSGEPGDDRGYWDANVLANDNGADWGGGNPCGITLSVGVKGHNIYGNSASMNYDDGYSTPECE